MGSEERTLAVEAYPAVGPTCQSEEDVCQQRPARCLANPLLRGNTAKLHFQHSTSGLKKKKKKRKKGFSAHINSFTCLTKLNR